jgi:ankyrin repeat protein
VNIVKETGGKILISAAAKGHVEVVTEFLNRGARVDVKFAYDSTPFSTAASLGHLESVRELQQY